MEGGRSVGGEREILECIRGYRSYSVFVDVAQHKLAG